MPRAAGRKANGEIKKGYRLTPSGRVVKAKKKTTRKRRRRR